MKQFKSRNLPEHIADKSMKRVSAFLEGERQQIDNAPWHESGDLPEASFSLAHNQQGIYLKYRVSEKHTLARYKKINDPVYKDSCVEFLSLLAMIRGTITLNLTPSVPRSAVTAKVKTIGETYLLRSLQL